MHKNNPLYESQEISMDMFKEPDYDEDDDIDDDGMYCIWNACFSRYVSFPSIFFLGCIKHLFLSTIWDNILHKFCGFNPQLW